MCDALNTREGGIGGTIIRNDDLCGREGLVQDALKLSFNECFTVVCAEHHRYRWRRVFYIHRFSPCGIVCGARLEGASETLRETGGKTLDLCPER